MIYPYLSLYVLVSSLTQRIVYSLFSHTFLILCLCFFLKGHLEETFCFINNTRVTKRRDDLSVYFTFLIHTYIFIFFYRFTPLEYTIWKKCNKINLMYILLNLRFALCFLYLYKSANEKKKNYGIFYFKFAWKRN